MSAAAVPDPAAPAVPASLRARRSRRYSVAAAAVAVAALVPLTACSAAATCCALPVSPMKDSSNRSSQRRVTPPVSRAGSVVTKTTETWSRSCGALRRADATSAMAVGHSSGHSV